MCDGEPGRTGVDIREMLELQLSEVEMLVSMFSGPGEFQMDDGAAIHDIRSFVDGTIKYDYLQSRIGFVVKVPIQDSKSFVEMVCHMPHEYPAVSPEIFTRAPAMTRDQHSKFSEDLHKFSLNIHEPGEICIGPVIQWIQDNVSNYSTGEEISTTDKKAGEDLEDNTFTRLWIYSHHIYSKFKRRDILTWAHELKLTGFSLPGKPGMICAEGYSRSVEDYWQRLRRLNWKKLAVKDKEEFDISSSGIDSLRKFGIFDEIAFDVRGGKGREYHMDLGQLFTYLKEHGCGHIFSFFFGVEGKSVSNDPS